MGDLEHDVCMYCKSMDVYWLLKELEEKSNDTSLGIQDNIFYHRAKIRIGKLMRDRYLEGVR